MKRIISVYTFLIFMILSLHTTAYGQYYSEVDQYLYPNKAQKAISMDLRNANLNDVLKIFSQQSGMNFIAASEIANLTVNLYLDRVPVEAALERILSANNLTYEVQEGSNIFVVKQLDRPEVDLMTRVYQLKHATIPSSKLNTTLSDFESGNSATANADGEGIVNAIEAILTENGRVIEYARNNSLVITDVPSQFGLIERTIKNLDIRIPQILIEVEMLDIAKGTSELLGAKWGNTPLVFSGASQRKLTPFDFDNIIQDNIPQSSQIAGAQTDFLEDQDLGANEENRYTASNLSFEGLTVMLQFLRTKTDTRSLARPRILTLNNETAEIQITTDEAIGLESSVTGADAGTEATTEAERANTGVILTVTPQANIQTGEIIMAIEPKVIQASSATGFVGAENFKNTEERGSKSILRVTDGDTIILGGLLRSEVSGVRQHIPGLGKIPILGTAFRHKDKSEEERELIIFITPQILKENYTTQFTHKKERNILKNRESDLSPREYNIDKELTHIENRY